MRAKIVLLLVIAGCTPERVEAPPPDAAFTARAVAFLDDLQGPSFEGDREYCGYFGYNADGEFAASGPDAGDEASCETSKPVGIEVIASYHTHGAYGTEYVAELPSPEDIDTDVAEGVFGFVSTPAGRVWLVDWRDETATEVCGRGCVAVDPDYDPLEEGSIGKVYTRASLAARFGY